MDHTQNLHLPQFAETDRIHHDDFNDAFSKLDTAVGSITPVIGSYTGDAENLPFSGYRTQTITLGFRPKFLLIFTGTTFNSSLGAILVEDAQITGLNTPLAQLTDTGFLVGTEKNGESVRSPDLNSSSRTYRYIAIG